MVYIVMSDFYSNGDTPIPPVIIAFQNENDAKRFIFNDVNFEKKEHEGTGEFISEEYGELENSPDWAKLCLNIPGAKTKHYMCWDIVKTINEASP